MAGSDDRYDALAAGTALAGVRTLQPKVHCIANDAAASLTANVLLAVGAVPSMTHNPSEAADFTKSADALSINLGMLTESRREAIEVAASTACDNDIPWVLDPVLSNRSPSRLKLCLGLLDRRPDVIRGNAREIDAICDAVNSTRRELARKRSVVVVITGVVDQIISGGQTREFTLGHRWMSDTTGTGCALSALIAATLAVIDDTFSAAARVMEIYGSTGQAASVRAGGPGTFVGHFLDCLHEASTV